jgi:hypothetical protein
MAFWPFRNKEHTSIYVEFIDVNGAATFQSGKVPVEDLPASFEAHTTIHLGTDDWEVLEARPMTAAEFRQSGKLVLKIRRLNLTKFSALDKVLYSLPTIADELPLVQKGSTKLGRDVLELHEDDWRQVEWVASSLTESIEAELAAIRSIYDREHVGIGFKKVHVRSRIPAPLRSADIPFDDLVSASGTRATILEGVSWRDVAGLTADSFALRLISSIEIYGQVQNGIVEVAAFQNRRINNMAMDDLRSITAFAREHELVLIDWCRATLVEAEDACYLDYFREHAENQQI